MGDSGNERHAAADVLDAVCEFVECFIVFPSQASTRAIAMSSAIEPVPLIGSPVWQTAGRRV
jgi:hypothetical protein